MNKTIILTHRPRRNRKSESIRRMVRETQLTIHDLVMPLFVIEGNNLQEEIKSMPGIYRYTPDLIVEQCKYIADLGIPAVALFPALNEEKKNKFATESYHSQGLCPQTIAFIKKELPELTVITDVAMDPYSSDGHDGVVTEKGEIDNDATLTILAQMSVAQAEAGSDMVAPSDMMDGRIRYIRQALDSAGYNQVSILSYSAKYASSFYGPFRDALESAPKHGDKKTYQMDPANQKEAIREVLLDIEEGADIVMIKPGLPYLDVVKTVRESVNVPVAVYNVSGEYAMLKAAGRNGWLDYPKVVMETLLGFKRAGADILFTYHAVEVAQWLSRNELP